MKNNIEIFNYLHDTGLSNLTFDFQNKKASIDFLLWDDIKQKEETLSINLFGISKFVSEYPKEYEFNAIGCHNANCTKINESKYEVTFLFDFLKQAVAWKVDMNFEKMEVKGGLSNEAFIFKFGEANMTSR